MGKNLKKGLHNFSIFFFQIFIVSGSEGCGLSSGDDLSLRHLAPSKREEITSIEFLPDTIPVNKSTQERVFMDSHGFSLFLTDLSDFATILG